MRSETQPYSTVIAIRLCRTAHAIFFPKFWNDKTNFTRVFITSSHREGPGTEVGKVIVKTFYPQTLYKLFQQLACSKFANIK